MCFKELLFKFNFLYTFISVRWLMKLSGKKIISPFYHTVIDGEDFLVKHLYRPKNKLQFKQDLNFLLTNFKPISAEILTEVVKGKKKITEDSFFLSFDDGLSSFYEIIAPILLEREIPAVVFLNNKCIGNKSLFYRYKISILIERLSKNKLSTSEKIKISNQINLNRISRDLLVKWLLKCDFNDNDKLDELSKILKVSFEDFLCKEKPYLSESQIFELIDKGFKFGGHSFSHEAYDLLDLDEQLRQTVSSVQDVQDRFNLDYKLFSFPFSDDAVSVTFFQKIKHQEITTFGTAGLKDGNVKTHIQRIPMEYNRTYSAEIIIKGELVYYILKRILKIRT